MHSTAEYCAPVWFRSDHTRFTDHAINDALQIATGCPRPTLANNLPILTGIQPAELRRKEATLSLARRPMVPGHLLHSGLSCPSKGNARHLKSRHPFVPAAQQLISSSDDNNRSEVECGKVRENYETPYFRTRPNLLERLCQEHRGSGSTASALMSDVSVPACTNGVWALSEACECGAEKQTVAHVVLQCPMHRPSHGMHNWLSAQRLPRDLVRPSSGLKKLPQTMMMFALYCYLYVGISWACIL